MDKSGPTPQQKPIHNVSGPARVYANRLLKVVTNLPLKGIERSAKFSPGSFLHERFLVGIAPAHWNAALFNNIYAELAMPAQLQKQFAASIAKANFLGLAFEQGERGCVYKAYVEYPVLINPHSADDGAPPSLQYQGFKWDPEAPDKYAVTDYFWTPRLSQSAIAAQFNIHLAQLRTPHIPELMQQVLAQAAARVDARQFVLLEVGEPGSSRKSVDLNMYCAGLKVGQFSGQIAEIAMQFGLDRAQVGSVLTRDADQALGHVSSGCDRNGEDFFTVYYDH